MQLQKIESEARYNAVKTGEVHIAKLNFLKKNKSRRKFHFTVHKIRNVGPA